MNDALSSAHQRAVHAVKRLGLECGIVRVSQGWQKQLIIIAGRGTVTSIAQLAEALQADVMTQMPEALASDWLNFELCIANDDTL